MAPTPLFNGMTNPGLSPSNVTPFTSFTRSSSFIPSGTTLAASNGCRVISITGTNHQWIELWTNDNGHYGINQESNGQSATIRAQLECPANLPFGTERWSVLQVRHNAPILSTATPPSGGFLSGAEFFTGGGTEIYGPPYGGSGPNSFRFRNGSGGLELYKNYKTATGTTVATFAKVIPPNRTYTIIQHFKLSSAGDANDGYEEVWFSFDGAAVAPVALSRPDGTTTTRATFCSIRKGVNDGGAQNIRINNYHRYGMGYTSPSGPGGWYGTHSTFYYGPFVYAPADVTNVSQIDPYTLLGGPAVAPVAAFNATPTSVGKTFTIDGSAATPTDATVYYDVTEG